MGAETESIADKADAEAETESDKADAEAETESIADKADAGAETESMAGKADAEAETDSIADKADAEAETDSIADKADAEAETESIAHKADAEAETDSIADEVRLGRYWQGHRESRHREDDHSEAEEFHSEAEGDAASKAEIALEYYFKSIDDKPQQCRHGLSISETCRKCDLEAGWVGIGSVQDCHPLNRVAKKRVMRRSRRLTKKIPTINCWTVRTSSSRW